jgi:hypothetical protein
MRVCRREQERNQVHQVLDRDAAFHAFGPQRKAGAGMLHDVAAEDHPGHALGAFEREARRAFVGNDPVERTSILYLDGVANKVRRELAIRIENVDEHLVGIPLAVAELIANKLHRN